MSDHGRHFDEFSAMPSHVHGGSYFDTGFGQKALQEAHGKLFDLFGAPRDSGSHGERYDEFGWRDMPAIHGQLFDTDFQVETAHDGAHSTWFDVFRGGRTEARYMYDGRDCEGVVIDVNPDFATVRTHDGQTHEVGLSQFLAYRTPNEQQAGPGTPEAERSGPSADNRTAHGSFHGERDQPGTGQRVQRVSEGPGNPDSRAGLPGGLMDTFTHLKSLAVRYDADDVEKGEREHVGYLAGDKVLCRSCGGGNLPRVHADDKRARNMSCSQCYAPLRDWTEKSVDSTETAVQAADVEGATKKTVGHRSNCPRGGSAPCGAAKDGRCSECNAQVRDHEAVGKANTGDLAIEVPEREHKSTDHHSSQTEPGRCPHCGQVLEQLAAQTAQGQPSRKDKEGQKAVFDTVSHKCVGTSIDLLKTLVEA